MENLKKFRKEKDITQIRLSVAAEVSQETISAYESGSKYPGLNSIVRIARALNVSVDQLCYGDESESFINSVPDEGRKIVNCIYMLWELGVIFYFDNIIYNRTFGMEDNSGFYLGIRKYPDQIKRLINSLNEFRDKKETFPDSDVYLESLLSSVANEINSMIAQENGN